MVRYFGHRFAQRMSRCSDVIPHEAIEAMERYAWASLLALTSHVYKKGDPPSNILDLRRLGLMTLNVGYVHEIFRNLESGDGAAFFAHVKDDVDWIVEGTHPLAGHYRSKSDFLAHTFEKLGKVLPQGTQLHLEHALVSGEWAVVELHSLATAKNGLKFDNRYCWVCRFASGKIAEVRAYLDSALVARLFEENPI